MSASDDDGVGYRRPPKHSRFKPGQSGNPKGRPKGSRSIAALVGEELDRKVYVIEGGRRKQQSKRQLAARQLADRAAKGEIKAILTIRSMEQSSEASALSVAAVLRPSTTELSDEQYEEALADFAATLKKESDA